jgi:hypothetical protein
MPSDEIRPAAYLGVADVYAIRSNHGAPPYLVACTVDGHWVCSCPADHPEIRGQGRYCRPIRAALALRDATSISAFDQKGGS